MTTPSPTSTKSKICHDGNDGGIMLNAFFGTNRPGWENPVGTTFTLIALLWCFMGVAIVADVFMGAIESITSQKKTIRLPGSSQIRTVKVWNDTIANLSLMALGSSAPEILLSLLELFSGAFYSGDLGPSTIVGSAAFNLLVILGVCVIAIPSPEVRKIKDLPVFAVTALFSLFAYVWLIVILQWSSPDIVLVWEGVLTFVFFPILLVLAFLADKGYFSKDTQGRIDEQVQIVSGDLSKEELAQVIAQIREEQKNPNLTEEEVVALMDQKQTKSRAARRVGATRNMTGGRKVVGVGANKVAPVELVESTPEKPVQNVGFLTSHKYSVLENAGSVTIEVSRSTTVGSVSVQWKTREGTATADADYKSDEGVLDFAEGEKTKSITVAIIDDIEYEDDEDFYVDISIAARDVPGHEVVIPNGGEVCTITIIDDDFPGTLEFPESLVQYASSESDEVHEIKVDRKNGATGKISCKYETQADSAIPEADYIHTEGVLEFEHNQLSAVIKVTVKAASKYEDAERFRIMLTEPTNGAEFNKESDGGGESEVLTIEIMPDDATKAKVDRISSLFRVNWDKTKLGNANYAEQFRAAMYVNGSKEEQKEAGVLDWTMHILTFPWKIIFALIPPTDYANGWVCFFLSLCVIGLVTAVIGDLASLFGCLVGMEDQITAITFVALGTSLPDLFASKSAAENDPYADASIGNVTGSNSVNVFLGLGLPWMIASVYWSGLKAGTRDYTEWASRCCGKMTSAAATAFHAKNLDGGFVVVAGSLAYSVTIFVLCAVACIAILMARRVVYGGELGGPAGPKWATFVVCIGLWFLYIALSVVRVNADLAAMS